MGTQLSGGIWPLIVYEGCNGQPFIPVILSHCGVHLKILLYPLVLLLRQAIGLWVECSADIAVDLQFGGECLCEVGCKTWVSVRDHLCGYSEPGEYVLEI